MNNLHTFTTNNTDTAGANSAAILPRPTVDNAIDSVGVLAATMTNMIQPLTIIHITIHVPVPTVTTSHIIYPVA